MSPRVSYTTREKLDSPEVTRTERGTRVRRHFFLDGTNNPEDVLATAGLDSSPIPAHGAAHPTLPGLYLTDVRVKPRRGLEQCDLTLVYEEATLGLTPGGELWQWDLGARQQKITSVPNGSYCLHYGEDTGLTIGLDGDRVEGVSVYRPKPRLKVTKVWPTVTGEYRAVLESLSGCVNDAPWFDWLGGEVLFLGSGISRRNDGAIQIDYSFEVARWQAPVSVLVEDVGYVSVQPPPWDYLWYSFKDAPGPTGDTIQRVISGVHLAQVYEYGYFPALELIGPYG